MAGWGVGAQLAGSWEPGGRVEFRCVCIFRRMGATVFVRVSN